MTLADWAIVTVFCLLGAVLWQLLRFYQTIAEFSRAMALAENNRRRPSEYQTAMAPRWLSPLIVLLSVSTIYLFVQDAHIISDVAACAAGFFLSGGISNYHSWPKPAAYAHFALRILRQRETAFRRRGKITEAEIAKHFHWLLTMLCGNALSAK